MKDEEIILPEEAISLESEDEPVELEEITIDDDEPISLVEPGETSSGQVRAISGAMGKASDKKTDFKRAINSNGTGATRCRMFHCRIAATPLAYMEEQINDWLDNSKAEVKQVTQTIGVMEGKSAEPNLIVVVWY
jgi:hypothetical protein